MAKMWFGLFKASDGKWSSIPQSTRDNHRAWKYFADVGGQSGRLVLSDNGPLVQNFTQLLAAGPGDWEIRAFLDNDGEQEVTFLGGAKHRLPISMKKA